MSLACKSTYERAREWKRGKSDFCTTLQMRGKLVPHRTELPIRQDTHRLVDVDYTSYQLFHAISRHGVVRRTCTARNLTAVQPMEERQAARGSSVEKSSRDEMTLKPPRLIGAFIGIGQNSSLPQLDGVRGCRAR